MITGLDHGLAAHDIRDSGRFRKIPWFDLFFFLLDTAGFRLVVHGGATIVEIRPGRLVTRVERAKQDEMAPDAMVHGCIAGSS